MRKHLPWGLILALCACQPTPAPDPNSHWITVDKAKWSAMSDMPYPFTADYGEIACDSYADLELAYFYPYDTGDAESATGVPLTSDAREMTNKAGLKPNVGEVFKDDVDLERLGREVLGVCGF